LNGGAGAYISTKEIVLNHLFLSILWWNYHFMTLKRSQSLQPVILKSEKRMEDIMQFASRQQRVRLMSAGEFFPRNKLKN